MKAFKEMQSPPNVEKLLLRKPEISDVQTAKCSLLLAQFSVTKRIKLLSKPSGVMVKGAGSPSTWPSTRLESRPEACLGNKLQLWLYAHGIPRPAGAIQSGRFSEASPDSHLEHLHAVEYCTRVRVTLSALGLENGVSVRIHAPLIEQIALLGGISKTSYLCF